MSRWGDRLKKVEQLAQSFQHQPLATRYKPRLWLCQPSSTWKLFPRQSLAFSFARSCKEAVHVFALEKESASPGQRIYLVTSYSELWHYYRTHPQSLMHCYEVIPEGAVCKLYFDLEFHKPSNKGADGKAMVASLIQYFCDKLMEVYGIRCSAQNVLNLDSSTEEKFSRHLIFNVQNAIFKDNTHVGRFIHSVLRPVLSKGKNGKEMDGVPSTKKRRQETTDLSFLQVKNQGQDCLFVDLGVYTKNRNFRLYGSSKLGKNAAFTVADDNQFIPKPEKGTSPDESIFLASLVCNVSFTGQRILTYDIPETKESTTCSLTGCQTSPHQEVDNFVLTLVRKEGKQGAIRRWNYFVAEQLLVYDIANYRWCENVQRFHKSNNILIVVDLKEEVWYQKCHDPDCRNFRSSGYPLPQEICVSYIMDEEDQAYVMDEAGNIDLSQSPDRQAAVGVAKNRSDVWGDDDEDYLQSLDDFELDSGEISDRLLLNCVTRFDSQ
uniref:DNA-directed primase/polymerase protein n=1 Tax=Cynoglossus semilaevis TaxID=244447 RepID=A0A3P8UXC4_CYNSE